ncbi:MAG: hypothetical protein V3W34_07475 [Phycisphaerae bacterium]
MGKIEGFAVLRVSIGRDMNEDFVGYRLGPVLFVTILLILIIQAGFVIRGVAPVFDDALYDPDTYMRLNRVGHLWKTGAWFDPVFPRINPPDGHVQHWTRPLDALLLVGGLLAGSLVGFRNGLYWWGVLISPVLQILSVFGLLWAVLPILQRQRLWLLCFLIVSQPAFVSVFMIGRPDHHSLTILLNILTIGLTIRLLLDSDRTNCAVWGGIVAAFAIWVAIEALPMVALSLAAVALSWLWGNRGLARIPFIYAFATFVAVAAALLAERGFSALNENEFDRISIAHLTLFGVNLVFWAGTFLLERQGTLLSTFACRFGWSVIGVAGGGVALWFMQPGFFESPLADVDELYRTVRLAHIEELQPVFSPAARHRWGWGTAVAMPLFWLGIAVPTLPYLGYLITTRSGLERRVWVFIGLGAVAFIALTVAQVRWSSYAEILLLPPYAHLAATLLTRVTTRLRGMRVTLVRPLLVIGLCTWFYLPTLMSGATDRTNEIIKARALCPLKPLAEFVSDSAQWGESPKRLLAFIDFGPELLYRTPHYVFAIPNHRKQPGFTASYRIMTSTDFPVAEALLRENTVDLIIICPDSFEQFMYRTATPDRTLYEALAAGEFPDFLEPVKLPRALSQAFRVFSIREAAESR